MKYARVSITGLALSLVGVASAAAGCSVAAEDAATVTQDERVTPTGEEDMASLTLQLPTGTCLAGGSCARPLAAATTFSLDSTPMTLGTTLRVAPGTHTLRMGNTSASIALTAREVRSFTVPVAKRVCRNLDLPSIPTTQFGRVPTLTNATCPAALSTGWSRWPAIYSQAAGGVAYPITAATDCRALSAPVPYLSVADVLLFFHYTDDANDDRLNCEAIKRFECTNPYDPSYLAKCRGLLNGLDFQDGNVAVAPGTYTFQVGSAVETRTIREGAIVDLDFNLPVVGTVPDTFQTSIRIAGPRELPDALSASSITSGCERNFTLPAGSAPLSLTAFKFAECDYVLNVGGRKLPLSQSASNSVVLHRIDIDDVRITREDGTTTNVRGTYEVFFGGARIAGPVATNTGVDALPGDYEVVVQFSTALGPQTKRYTLHF